MEVRNKVYFTIVVLLFYVGDILTTYLGLQKGGYEANPIMASVGFYGTIIIKTAFIAMILVFISYLEKHQKYVQELGVILGSVIAFGLLTVLNNIGFYR
jgi:uncharacterized membrane-anchored protein